jgi:hypothetical protein
MDEPNIRPIIGRCICVGLGGRRSMEAQPGCSRVRERERMGLDTGHENSILWSVMA